MPITRPPTPGLRPSPMIACLDGLAGLASDLSARTARISHSALGLAGRATPGAMRHARLVHHGVPARFFGSAAGAATLRIGLITDLHLTWPWSGLGDLAIMLERLAAARPDLVVVVGDHEGRNLPFAQPVDLEAAGRALCAVGAPLGVVATLGNHDWIDDPVARETASPPHAQRALEAGGVRVLRNAAMACLHGGRPFWLVGLDDQLVGRAEGGAPFADLDAALAPTVTDDHPVVLLAHEPDVFAELGGRRHVGLTLSGHMHAGQIRLGRWAPGPMPSRHGKRYLHGVIDEAGRRLVVSSGLGYSGLPLRLGAPPEVVVLDVELP